MARNRPSIPLDAERLRALALHYVGRYATTRHKLTAYLSRKIKERGWADAEPADVTALVERIVELGYVDDQAFATARAAGLSRRGYGPRRVAVSLREAGIDEEDRQEAMEVADAAARDAAIAFARRRRLGPFAARPADDKERRRQFAAMLRAGHGFELTRSILEKNETDADHPES